MKMIQLNQQQFAYDIHSLVKAFYPDEEVKISTQNETDPSNPETPDLEVELTNEQVCCRLWVQGKLANEEILHWEKKEDRKSQKSKVKQLLYRLLSVHTGKQLPWGNLTGIRPTKIAYSLLEEGKEPDEIIQYMQTFYDASEEKSRLSLDIAQRERAIVERTHGLQGYSLYVGIPFCPTTCLYCSFTSYPIGKWKKQVSDYLTALEAEIKAGAAMFPDKILDTVYIGGGTPTTLEPDELARLFTILQENFDFSPVQEFTVEAGRADSIDRNKLQVMKDFGVTRVSVNPQTMKESTLKLIGRHHTVEQVKEAFSLAREVGIPNINMDLILGLPEETADDVAMTMEEVGKLKPESLTIHSLSIKRASGMSQWVKENGSKTLQNTEEIMEIARKGAEAMGMQPYYLYRQKNITGNLENVGYATEGNYGIYNILMMEEKQDILAFGAGTISKRVHSDGRIQRCDTVKDVALYIEKIEEMIERKRELFGDS